MPPGHLDHFLQSVGPVLHQYGYAAVFVLIFLENFGMPVPGETAFLAALVLAARGDMRIVPVALSAWTGACLGGGVGFVIGRFGGRRLLEKYGPYVWITSLRLTKAERFYQKYGGAVVVLARFFHGFRQIYAILAGCVATSWRRFLVYNIAGATLWVLVWTLVLFWFGRHARHLWESFQEHELLTLLVVAILATCGLYLLRRRKKMRIAKDSERTNEQSPLG